MDQHKLRNLVFEKTGVRIDIDDPIFALVALNEAVLAEAVERHVALLHDATRELAGQVAALQDGGATALPAALRSRPAQRERRMLAIAGGAALLAALLVLCGQALLFNGTAAAHALTPEQSAALRHGAKLARAVETLDPKARAAVAAAMRTP